MIWTRAGSSRSIRLAACAAASLKLRPTASPPAAADMASMCRREKLRCQPMGFLLNESCCPQTIAHETDDDQRLGSQAASSREPGANDARLFPAQPQRV